uniref:DUF148 domain-containing protein n=1 Tax=Rhabditophanes sp. KR3021 TaxID=114890 RepID=A0AC35U757_9BILA
MVVYQLSGTLNLIDALQLDLPAHLIVASDAARKSYFEIQQNPNIKKSLKNKALKSWAHEQSDAVSSLYDKYLTNLETQNNSHKEKIAECIKNIPDAGQQANLKIQQILDNNDITQKQEQTMINAILSPLNGSIVASLMDINQRCG